MFKYLRKKKAQSTLEYAILIIIVIGALLSIQIYVKRGVQGRLKSATDDIGDQYKPFSSNMTVETYLSSNTRDTFSDGASNSELTARERSWTNTTTNMLTGTQEFWGGK